MENLKENIEKIYKLNKENNKIKENNNKLIDKSTELYHKDYEEFTKNEKTIKENNKKIELNNLKIAILKNNIHYLLKIDFEGIKPNILYYYENKKIGEKTKEKIENEIKEYYKNNFNINIGCYLSINSSSSYEYTMTITIYFLNNEGYKDFTLNYNEEFKIQFSKYKYNNFELQINYFNNINDYIELKDLNKKANELLKDYNKTVEKIEKLRLQQKELYHNFTDYLQAFVYNYLEIKTDIRIY